MEFPMLKHSSWIIVYKIKDFSLLIVLYVTIQSQMFEYMPKDRNYFSLHK
jgi:hypothetical protein